MLFSLKNIHSDISPSLKVAEQCVCIVPEHLFSIRAGGIRNSLNSLYLLTSRLPCGTVSSYMVIRSRSSEQCQILTFTFMLFKSKKRLK